MSRHVKRVRSQFAPALLCASEVELVKARAEKSVQVQLRSPVYPAIGLKWQERKEGKWFWRLVSTSKHISCGICQLWHSSGQPYEWTRVEQNPLPWQPHEGVLSQENRSSQPITDLCAAEDAGRKKAHCPNSAPSLLTQYTSQENGITNFSLYTLKTHLPK